ncbi:hypothetical protein VNO77_04253 [Canavalia gladiata]|uniref:Uncharacterized protein n=1 Tax=Canavalia gladiata TaxID=3824 RepID=A0AAN9R4N1_CANGL
MKALLGEWKGVTCNRDRQVMGLDLSEESISGGFDNLSTLFALQYLLVLNLSYNDFNSMIPSSFSKLHKLTYLNLAYAGFRGHIPMEISQLSRLLTLHLSVSQPMELEIDLGKLVLNLTKVRQLHVDGVSISAHGQEWRTTLLQIPTLLELSMLHDLESFIDKYRVMGKTDDS